MKSNREVDAAGVHLKIVASLCGATGAATGAATGEADVEPGSADTAPGGEAADAGTGGVGPGGVAYWDGEAVAEEGACVNAGDARAERWAADGDARAA